MVSNVEESSAHAVHRIRAAAAGRERSSLNDGWRFSRFTSNPDSLSYDTLKPWILPQANDFLSGKKYDRPTGTAPGGNVQYTQSNFDDSSWQAVDLPHDWAITGTFDAPGVGGGQGMLPSNGIGWYRRTVTFDASLISSGKSIYLDVDGALSYSAVWLNGNLAGGWPYGYNSFRVDLTPYAKAGQNTLAIRVDNPIDSSRWYPGGGIYRNVWLVTANPVHVGQYGTYITTSSITSQSASVQITVDVENKKNSSQQVQVGTEIFELEPSTRKPSGKAVASFPASTINVAGSSKQSVNASTSVSDPKLWGPAPAQTPNEYVAVTTVSANGTAIDTYETIFGIRSVTYDPNQGILINGKKTRIQGSCNHHDLGSLGAAWNDRAAERQVQMLQEMGNNALRTSHNPPAPELLDIADRLGLVVMVSINANWKRWKLTRTSNRTRYSILGVRPKSAMTSISSFPTGMSLI